MFDFLKRLRKPKYEFAGIVHPGRSSVRLSSTQVEIHCHGCGQIDLLESEDNRPITRQDINDMLIYGLCGCEQRRREAS